VDAVGSIADSASGADSPGAIVLIGLTLVAFGGWLLISAWRIRARGVRVPGTVLGCNESAGDSGTPMYQPIFRFTTLEARS
jgi:hypothetical protein